MNKIDKKKMEVESASFKFSIKKDGNVFLITFTKNKIPITWRNFITLIKGEDEEFCKTMKDAILTANFKA